MHGRKRLQGAGAALHHFSPERQFHIPEPGGLMGIASLTGTIFHEAQACPLAAALTPSCAGGKSCLVRVPRAHSEENDEGSCVVLEACTRGSDVRKGTFQPRGGGAG